MCMLVNRVKDEIASELVHNLYAQITSLETLLRETDDVASRRRELMEQLAVLNRGIGILNEIRDAGILAAPPTAGAAGNGAAGELVGAGMGAGAGAGSEGYGRGDKGAAAAAPAPYSSRSHPQGSSPGSGAAEGEEGGVGRGSLGSGAAKGGGAGGIGRRSLETQHASAVPSQAPPRLGSNAGV